MEELELPMTLNTIVCVSRSILLPDILYIFIPSFLAKFSRQNSIHVSPTVLWDGLIANEVSSGWEQQDWVHFFESKVAQ